MYFARAVYGCGGNKHLSREIYICIYIIQYTRWVPGEIVPGMSTVVMVSFSHTLLIACYLLRYNIYSAHERLCIEEVPGPPVDIFQAKPCPLSKRGVIRCVIFDGFPWVPTMSCAYTVTVHEGYCKGALSTKRINVPGPPVLWRWLLYFFPASPGTRRGSQWGPGWVLAVLLYGRLP